MSKASFTIEFDGYWREGNERDVPAASGVYCVYEARMVLATGQLKPQKLVYVGESDNARKDITANPKREEWRKHVGRGNHLCYAFAPVASADRKRVAATLIHVHKPPSNDQHIKVFTWDRTNVMVAGMVGTLSSLTTAHRTKDII
jgi:hypothetical protein